MANRKGQLTTATSSPQSNNAAAAAVDLTAESSSVTSLPASIRNKSQQQHAGKPSLPFDQDRTHCTTLSPQKGSVTSTDSGLGFYDQHHHADLAQRHKHQSRAQRPPPHHGRHRKCVIKVQCN